MKMVKAKADLVLYGAKSSGKTTLATKVLNTCLGVDRYVTIRSIFVHDRNAFIYLLG